jgi:pyruvate,water dikinase
MTGAEQRWVYFFGDGPEVAGAPDKAVLGGKGASLAAMSKAGLPVPDGFTISTECCRAFYANEHRWPDGLEGQVRQNMARLEEVTGRKFGRGPQPLLVSVRSGAAVSMPGMMDTILHCGLHPGLADEVGDTPAFWSVMFQFIETFAKTAADVPADVLCATNEVSSKTPRRTGLQARPETHETDGFERTGLETRPAASFMAAPTREVAERFLRVYEEQTGREFPIDPWQQLTECISAVFRSWNTARAVAYRRHHDIRGLHGTAVNVQAMFPSQVSGILFTQDPNDLPAEQMVVESSYGLGEAVVSGEVTPDRFVVRRSDLQPVRTVLGNKGYVVAAVGDAAKRDADQASLSDEQLTEVCRLGLRIEELYGQPMDIEWGWADGEFSLLQCRPIRGLEIARDVEPARQSQIERLRKLADGKRLVWVAHNLGETLRGPTPLTWDIVRQFMSGDGGYGQLYKDLGYRPSREVCRAGFLELIGQRVYADPQRVAQLFWGGGPMTYDLDALERDPGLLDRAPTAFDADKADGKFFLHLPGMILSMLRASRIAKRMRETVKETFENQVLPRYLDCVKQERGRDLSGLETTQVIAELNDRRGQVLDHFGNESLKPGFFGGLAFGELQALLVQLLGREQGIQMACTLTMGLEGDTTVEQNELLYRVATGEAPLEQFEKEYGHRAVNEMELAEPRWREDRQQIEQALRGMRAGGRSPLEIHREHAEKRAEVETELPDILAQWGGSSFREEIQQKLQQARALLGYRESAKHYLMMGYELLRLAILELSRRWDLGRDIFFLRLDELPQFERDRSRLDDAIADRKVRWQSLQRLDLPDVVDSNDLGQLGLPQQYEAAAELDGDAVAAGTATGTARIVFDPRRPRDLGTDYILVCPSTDPGWTSLFVNARGLVVERGGVLSHGAIVARDFGIPAVVCAGATSRIQDGDRVQVDGNRGEIRILESE